jgi:hypothetical protein
MGNDFLLTFAPDNIVRKMDVKTFIGNFKEAFGETVELPVAFWYSNSPVADNMEKINGCFFKAFETLKKGESIAFSLETLGCMGGKYYTGFSEMNPKIPDFVSLREKYKKTPGMVMEFVKDLGVPLAEKKYLNISPVNQIDSFDNILGIVFFASPDVLSGLIAWTFLIIIRMMQLLQNLVRDVRLSLQKQ